MSLDEIERILITRAVSHNVWYVHIFTKPDYYIEKEEFYNQTKFFTGYYQARTFYSPRYQSKEKAGKPDFRSTIYWVPEVTTDSNGEASVSYFNPDSKTEVRVNIQGISANGIPIVGEMLYSIH